MPGHLDQSGHYGVVTSITGIYQTCPEFCVFCIDINTTGQTVIHSLQVVNTAVSDKFSLHAGSEISKTIIIL